MCAAAWVFCTPSGWRRSQESRGSRTETQQFLELLASLENLRCHDTVERDEPVKGADKQEYERRHRAERVWSISAAVSLRTTARSSLTSERREPWARQRKRAVSKPAAAVAASSSRAREPGRPRRAIRVLVDRRVRPRSACAGRYVQLGRRDADVPEREDVRVHRAQRAHGGGEGVDAPADGPEDEVGEVDYRRARRADGVEAHDEVERRDEGGEAEDDDDHGRVDRAREVALRVLHVARDVVCLDEGQRRSVDGRNKPYRLPAAVAEQRAEQRRRVLADEHPRIPDVRQHGGHLRRRPPDGPQADDAQARDRHDDDDLHPHEPIPNPRPRPRAPAIHQQHRRQPRHSDALDQHPVRQGLGRDPAHRVLREHDGRQRQRARLHDAGPRPRERQRREVAAAVGRPAEAQVLHDAAVARRQREPELRERRGAGPHEQPAEQPHGQPDERRGERVRGDLRRRGEDAGADLQAEDEREGVCQGEEVLWRGGGRAGSAAGVAGSMTEEDRRRLDWSSRSPSSAKDSVIAGVCAALLASPSSPSAAGTAV